MLARPLAFAVLASLLSLACAASEGPPQSASAGDEHQEPAPPAPRREAPREPVPVGAPADPFAREMLEAHNRVRREARPTPAEPIPPLVWDESLAAFAREWASRCPDGHRPDNDYGENLHWSGGMPGSAEDAVRSWAAEAAYYDYASTVCRKNGRASWASCGHYTQLVWRDTQRVGCAMRTDCPGDYENVVVCNYDPPGNVNVGATTIPHPY